MFDTTPLKLASLAYAVFWTLAMIWLMHANDAVAITMFIICGAINGLLWFWMMRKFQRWTLRRL